MKEPVVQETDYKVGEIWYVKERTDEGRYMYTPVKIIEIYSYILLTENMNGRKQAFTKACAFLHLFTAADAVKRRKTGQ